MEEKSSVQQLKKIYEALEHKKKINVFGSPGAGKTWMVKRVSDRGAKHDLYKLILWVFMCRDYDEKSLSESIARQLCLLPSTEEWEVEDDSMGQKDDDVVESETLIQKLRRNLEGKEILLVLDDATEKKEEEKFWSVWRQILPRPSDNDKLHTILVSRSSREDEDVTVVEVETLPRAESDSILIEKLDARLRESEKILTLGKEFIEKSNGLPGTVTMIAKALSYFGLDGVSMLEKELEETSEKYRVSNLLCRKHDVLPISILKDFWWPGHHYFRDSGSVHYSELITYWILEGYLGFGSMTKLYEKGHGVLMELMDCGIIKGQEGGYVFMDQSLINVDDLYQCVDEIASLGLATVFTSDTEGFGRITHKDGMLKTPRMGRKGQNQDQKQSLEEGQNQDQKQSLEEGQNLSTLLLDGTHFSDNVLRGKLESEKELQVLALFDPTIRFLPEPLATMKRLRVLVLRGCEFLENIKLPLPALRVLEISGASSLKKIKPDFFKDMQELQSLHLSGLQITSLPQTFYSLIELRWLVIKDCRRLRKLESLTKLEKLMVVDFSGNIALESVDKNFLKFSNLQSLNLSNTMVSTTPLLNNSGQLTHLLVRGCKNLGRLRGLTSLRSLQTLDLSGSTTFEDFHDSSLKSLTSLRTLDLSGTNLDRLPSSIANPRYLYLKSCPLLEQLSLIESLVNLEVLDLSGSKNLNEIEDVFFSRMSRLQVLNLSETKVAVLPSLSNLSSLRELLLSHCASLKQLPSLESITKLEVLDVSQCSALDDIGNASFERMSKLQKLDFSETKIKSLPTLPNPSNLCQLLLRNCTTLQNLELNAYLFNLKELNLSGITSLKPNSAEFVKDMSNLQILDLSCTLLDRLPSMSNLTNLTHLSLAGCSCLETVPDLNPLTRLEVLDLSGSSIKHLPKLNSSSKLRKLLLKDCSMVEDLPDVKVNNLLGPTLNVHHWISGLSHLDYLEFPKIMDIQGVVESHEECSSEEVKKDQWNICGLSDVDTPPLFLSGTQFLQILQSSHLPQEAFHLCAIPVMVEGETRNRYIQRHELVFGDVYLQTGRFSRYKGKRLLQIRGFNHSPKGMENVISHVDLVFLIDNKFKSMLSGLTASALNELKGCWIERCNEMVTIFDEKEGKDYPKLVIALENLGISNNASLESIYKGEQPFGSFNSLKTLYLDGCPKLSTVFPSSWLPKTLEVLQIKHCDKIVSLFQAEGELPNLTTLHLWELPKLENISISFPSLRTLKIWECPKVKQIDENFEFAKSLTTLWISGAANLKSLDTGNQESRNFLNLETLKLESCPMLRNVLSSCLLLENIKIIDIRSCEKLQTLFVDGDSNDNLRNLKTLHLEDLPVLKTIGATLPSQLETRHIFECTNLQPDGTSGDQN